MKTLLLFFLPLFCFAQSETSALKKQRLRIEAGLKKEYNYTAAYLNEITKFHKNKSTPAKIERKKAIALAYFENDYPKVEQDLAAYFKKTLDTVMLKSYFETVFIEKKVRKLQEEQPIVNVFSSYPNAVIAILHQYKGGKLEYLLRFIECGFDRSPNIIKNKQQKRVLKQLKTDFKRIKIKDFNLICYVMR